MLTPTPDSANSSAVFRQKGITGEYKDFSLSVPYNSGSSRDFSAPGPQFGSEDRKTQTWPPQPDWGKGMRKSYEDE